VNGTTTTTSYNAANQVTNAGYSYDAAGNLLNDGTTSHVYDALHRVTSSGGVSSTYNGDGVLVQRGATRYTQDLAVPLAQILNDGATTYVYDHGSTRLLADDGSARTWYVGDALGSVRMTLDDAGTALGSVGYDPWGAPQGELLGAFGFTGALQDGASNLLYLRARWYDPGQSTFTSRDPFAGFPATPYSLHPYQYAYSNPALWTDPSGKHPDPARRQLTKTEEKFIEAIIQVDYVRSYIGLDLALNFRVFDNDGSIGGNVAAPDTIPIVNFTLHEFYSIVPADDYATTSSVFGRLDHARRRQYLNIHIPPDWERSGNNYRYPSPLSARDLDFARGDPRPKKQYTRASIVAARTRRVITLWPVVAGSGYNPDIDGHWALVAWQDALNDGLIFYIGVKLSKRDRRLAKQPVLVYLPEEIAELLGGCPPLEPVPEGDGYQRPIPLPPGTLTPEPGSTLISIPGGNPYPPRRRNRP
jgi:RHS repeat-associated protein